VNKLNFSEIYVSKIKLIFASEAASKIIYNQKFIYERSNQYFKTSRNYFHSIYLSYIFRPCLKSYRSRLTSSFFLSVINARLFGLFLITAGLIWSSNFEDYNLNFFAGMITGTGVPFLVTGKFRFWKWKFPEPKQ